MGKLRFFAQNFRLKYWSILPADHSAEVKRQIIRCKDGPSLKTHTMAVCGTWIVAVILLLDIWVGLWSLVPESLAASHIISSNMLFTIGASWLCLTIALWVILYFNSSATSATQFHTFANMCFSSFQMCEYLLVGCCLLIIVSLNYVMFLRIRNALPDSDTAITAMICGSAIQVLMYYFFLFYGNWMSLVVMKREFSRGSDGAAKRSYRSVHGLDLVGAVAVATQERMAQRAQI